MDKGKWHKKHTMLLTFWRDLTKLLFCDLPKLIFNNTINLLIGFEVIYFSLWSKNQTQTHTASVSRFLDQTDTHVKTPLSQWSARRRVRYLHNKQQNSEIYSHVLSGIRTHISSNREATDLRLWSHGQWDPSVVVLGYVLRGSDQRARASMRV